MKYFALFILFYSLNTFTCDYPKENKQTVYINNNSKETISCWLSSYANPSFVPPVRLLINPESATQIKVKQSTTIDLFRLVNNTNTCLTTFQLTPADKRIIITPRAVHKELKGGRQEYIASL